MDDRKAFYIRLAVAIAASILTLVVAAAFLYQIIDIYGSGPEKPFTAENVAEHLRAIAVPIWLWIAAVIAGAAVEIALPSKKRALKVKRSNAEKLASLEKKRSHEAEEKLPECADKLRKRRLFVLTFRIAASVVALAGAIYGIVYFCTLSNFPSVESNSTIVMLNDEVIRMAARLLPLVITSFAAFIAVIIFENVTAKRALDSARAIAKETAAGKYEPIKGVKDAAAALAPSQKTKKYVLLGVRVALLVLGVTFIIIGIMNGGAKDVLVKAINICTECIGLG